MRRAVPAGRRGFIILALALDRAHDHLRAGASGPPWLSAFFCFAVFDVGERAIEARLVGGNAVLLVADAEQEHAIPARDADVVIAADEERANDSSRAGSPAVQAAELDRSRSRSADPRGLEPRRAVESLRTTRLSIQVLPRTLSF
jgi:hypothetical protein